MDFFALLAVAIGGLIIISFILSWVNRFDLNGLRNEVQQLRHQIDDLLKQSQGKEVKSESQPDISIPAATTSTPPPAPATSWSIYFHPFQSNAGITSRSHGRKLRRHEF